MRQRNRLVATALAALLITSVLAPGLAAAETEESNDLTIDVAQDDGVLATVSDENGSVANASLNVSVDDANATYEGAGAYTTDENGTVELPTPTETVNVTLSAESGNLTASESATLTAESDEESEEREQAFGQQVQTFVEAVLQDVDEDSSVGQQVSEWVTANNPGNAPDHAGAGNETGPPEHAGSDEKPEQAGDGEKPDDAGPDGERGPPEDRDADDEETDDEETDEETDDEE